MVLSTTTPFRFYTAAMITSGQSAESRRAEAFMRVLGAKKLMPLINSVANFINAKPSLLLYRDFNIVERTVRGRSVRTLSPRRKKSPLHILYLHGGSYVMGFHRQHWKMISYLAGELSCSVTAPDYPLAPAAHVDDVFDMVLPIYRETADEAGASNVCIMGDSAGGGLSLALAQRIREEGLEQPGRIILLAPWLDVSLSNPDIAEIDQIDPCLNVEGLRDVGIEYAGSAGTQHYLVSPINGSLEALAPVTLFVGTHDILLADCRRLKARAAREGLVLDYHEIEGLVHPGVLMSLPEADEIRREIVRVLGRAYDYADIRMRSTSR